MHILATSFLSFKAQATFIGSPNWCATEGLSKSYWGSGCCNWPKRVSLCPYLLINNGCLVAVKCVVSSERDDGFYMRRCVEIAKKALGFTSPNPMVGCVIVKDGEIIGEGFHPKAGQPHAEVFALRDAGDLAENATAYVSLEPCNHFGRTPPCTEALIQAKVKHVVVGMVDPNPIVASKGVERLRKSGIEVKVGVEEELCKKLNEAYIHRMFTGRPFVALRYSLLLNGHMSNQLGEGAEEPGGYYSKLMQEYDGIIISSVHLAKDSSALKFEETGARQPLLIIVATPSNSPICLPTLTTGSQAIVFKDKHAIIDQATELNLHQVGTKIVVLEQMDLESILDYCGQKGLCSVLIDLRGRCGDFMEIIRKGLEDGLLQKLIMELLPFWVGKKESLLVEYNNLGERTVKLKDLQTKVLNGSVMVDGYIC